MNKFKVGDSVMYLGNYQCIVEEDLGNKVYRLLSKCKRLSLLAICSEIKHCKPEEIKAGRRL